MEGKLRVIKLREVKRNRYSYLFFMEGRRKK
jgi:hypothetical protein